MLILDIRVIFWGTNLAYFRLSDQNIAGIARLVIAPILYTAGWKIVLVVQIFSLVSAHQVDNFKTFIFFLCLVIRSIWWCCFPLLVIVSSCHYFCSCTANALSTQPQGFFRRISLKRRFFSCHRDPHNFLRGLLLIIIIFSDFTVSLSLVLIL